ncbi:MAG: hypothetical protein M3Z04_17445 [Chloroflexota bacterium]|nr:hypothetical protein [Chloroflexota bacterium]
MPSRHSPTPLNGPVPPAPRRHAADSSGYIVRASELGQWSYCERAWWLRYMAKVEPSATGQARLAGGHLRHAEHGQGVAWAAALWRLGWICAALAAVLAVAWLLGAAFIH